MEKQLFNLKWTSKQMQRESKHCEKREKQNKLKLKLAIQKGNMDGARIYAENAIREKNQSLNYLRLASRIDAVAGRVETAVRMRMVTKSMGGIVKNLEAASKSMNLEKMTKVMDQFEKEVENLDVQSMYMEGAMSQTSTLTTPQDQVDSLISQVADEHGLELSGQLATPQSAAPQPVAASSDDLQERLARLKALS
ncbi:chromatin modifying protein 1b, putative [Acanthamoeba castellanii str. Neff]|uniref:Chromatin modifying protein 1b, putative n=1 Tax=Acanthamoeba castellanii (strain ATCC 30010 / Neff) TaxID=1257118 RepID=L8GY90_ACACF|nr:chromatin modifying protein 1b, putative [Acanthamoeba castellanii str. Neff]ELR17051.1 chromatin modifying protein 1b, putative [Acanthamoeba castellanii str. Neff]